MLERNLILKETKEVLYPDFYKEKAPDAVTKWRLLSFTLSLCFKDVLRLHMFIEHAEMGSRVVKFLISVNPIGLSY